MALQAPTALRIGLAVAAVGALAWSHFRPDGEVTIRSDTAIVQPQSSATAQTWKLGEGTPTACELARPNSGLSTAACCVMFPVPENRADSHRRAIRLKLAVLRKVSA